MESNASNDKKENRHIVQDIEISRRGRPKDFTSAESLKQKEKILMNRNECLRKEGVRCSDRLANLDHAQLVNVVPLPRNFDESYNNINREEWQEAMEDELRSLYEYDVWDICEYPINNKTVKSKWVYSIKRINDNNIKFKARLVATGYNQIKDQDYEESYSPVIGIDTWRALIAIATNNKKNLNVKFFDVKNSILK